MRTDAKRMRGEGPTVFAQAKEGKGEGVDDIVGLILDTWREATGGH
jgi:Ni2+-binding GTPase involved in maturation of urease and hydrogenase